MVCKLIIAVTLIICILPVFTSPHGSRYRTRTSAPTYDQKQTGDYNIQLHLKDFQVVALLSESAFADLGDYDYSYDYSDLTVKPGHHTTSKPTSAVSITSTATTPTTTTPKPLTTQTTTHQPHHITHQEPSTTTTRQPITTTTVPTSTTASPPTTTRPTTPPSSTTTVASPTTTPANKVTQKIEKETKPPVIEIKTTQKPTVTTPITTTEKRIHVEVITTPPRDTKTEESTEDNKLNENDKPIDSKLIDSKLTDNKVTDIKLDDNKLQPDLNMVPGKPAELSSVHNKEESNQTELLAPTTYRKCANGFTRDKQGRCRRVRRPVSQFPFGISRLATLASKLRQASTEGQNTPNIE